MTSDVNPEPEPAAASAGSPDRDSNGAGVPTLNSFPADRAHGRGKPKHKRGAGGLRSSTAQAALRALPSVDLLARLALADAAPNTSALEAARLVLVQARQGIEASGAAVDRARLVEQVRDRLRERARAHLRAVVNATGVIVNTNLGRAPLSEAALEAMHAVAAGYSNLEYDLEEGERGSRQAHTRDLIAELTGAEDAFVVNNNAAAVLVALAALAAGRDVVISRGELVEIGGGFRVPDVLRQSGAHLVEVGTTNRTRCVDYEAALTAETALLLCVHPSNFRVVGFAEAPAVRDLATLAHAHGLPIVHDLGSGCLLATERWGLAHEPMPQESIAAGVDIVCFSGDKLLGGPQAGILAGRRALLERIGRHPLSRAVRCDKLTLAALEATLRHYRSGEAEQVIPIWQAISAPLAALRARSVAWADHARALGFIADVADDQSWIGGGSLPGEALPTVVCRLRLNASARLRHAAPVEAGTIADLLRRGTPPVITRVSRGLVLLDPRTVLPDQDALLLAALAAVMRTLQNS